MSEPILFGAAYYPEDWPESERPKDIEMMKKAGMNVMRFGEFAWHNMEPRPGEFDFAWLHRVVDDLAANGIKSILGTPTATPPRWFLLRYPDAANLTPNGARELHGGRRHCCSNNPDYRRHSAAIVEAMAREFGDDPNVIGWQLDNEIYGGGNCCCDYCRDAFHNYLREKYGTIEEVNKQWNLNIFSQAYDDFDEIQTPTHSWQNPHIRLEWFRFHYQCDMDFIHSHARILRQYTKAPIGTDMMPLNGMGYQDMTAPLDVLQFNHYNTVENLPMLPLWYDFLRSFGKPFWNTETSTGWNGSAEIGQVAKPVGFCRTNSWLPVALGGEANLYWLWRQHWAGHELMHGSVIYANGRPLPMFDEVQRISREFEIARDFLRQTRVDTRLAMHFTSLSWQLFLVQPMISDFQYHVRVPEDIYLPITRMGLRPDVIDSGKDLSGYKVLVSPMVMSLEDRDLPQRIEAWVREGGHWVVGPMTDIRNSIGAHYRDRAMGCVEELTGCQLVASIPDSGVVVKSRWSDGSPMSANYWQQLYTPAENGQVLASVTEGYAPIVGTALVQKVPCGKGAIWLLGTDPDPADLQKLMAMVCADAGIQVPETTGTVTVIPRSGNGRKGLILMETANAPAGYRLEEPMTDLLTGRTYDGFVALKPYDLLILESR